MVRIPHVFTPTTFGSWLIEFYRSEGSNVGVHQTLETSTNNQTHHFLKWRGWELMRVSVHLRIESTRSASSDHLQVNALSLCLSLCRHLHFYVGLDLTRFSLRHLGSRCTLEGKNFSPALLPWYIQGWTSTKSLLLSSFFFTCSHRAIAALYTRSLRTNWQSRALLLFTRFPFAVADRAFILSKNWDFYPARGSLAEVGARPAVSSPSVSKTVDQ